MKQTTKNTTTKPVRKTYHSPELVNLGSVRQLTLKIGSVSDGFAMHVA